MTDDAGFGESLVILARCSLVICLVKILLKVKMGLLKVHFSDVA